MSEMRARGSKSMSDIALQLAIGITVAITLFSGR